MPPRNSKTPVSGQRSISTFFATKPKLQSADAAAATASPAKLLRGEAATDVAAAKDSHSNFTPGAAAVTPPTAASAPKSAKASKVGSGSKVQGKAVGGEALGPAAVGRAIRVYWPGEDAWFTGEVVEARPAGGKCLVLYEDGDEEWVDLTAEKWAWVEPEEEKEKENQGGGGRVAAARAKAGVPKAGGAAGKAGAKAGGGGRKRKAAIVESDSGEEDEEDGAAAAASGSEYAASDDGESDEEDASLADECEEESADEEMMSGDGSEGGSRRRGGKGKDTGVKGSKGGAKIVYKGGKASGGAGSSRPGPGRLAATPVAVSGGSMGLTPGSAAASGLPLSALASGTSTAVARPPRTSLPAKTPGTGGTPATTLACTPAAGGTPLTAGIGGGGGSGEVPGSTLREDAAPRCTAVNLAAFPFLHADRLRDAAKRRPDHPDFARPASFCSLPDDCIRAILDLVQQRHRLNSVVLVSRDMRRLANMCTKLTINLAVEQAERRAQSLPLWLRPHARHIQHLTYRSFQHTRTLAAQREYAGVLANTMLATTCATAKLKFLDIACHTPMPSLAWLPMVATTLTRLTIILDARNKLQFDACLGGMVKLSEMHLVAKHVSLKPRVKLPPNLMSLIILNHCVDDEHTLPRQVLELSKLAKLNVYANIPHNFARLAPPTTSLVTVLGPTSPAWLSKNTHLQRLQILSSADSPAMDCSLSALHQLTCLALETNAVPTAALTRLTNLRHLLVARSNDQRALPAGNWLANLPAGAWLAGLRWLCVAPTQLMNGWAALQSASNLERVTVAQDSDALEGKAAEWWAVCDWAACHMSLTRMDFITMSDEPPLPAFILSNLLRLEKLRPALLVVRDKRQGSNLRLSGMPAGFMS